MWAGGACQDVSSQHQANTDFAIASKLAFLTSKLPPKAQKVKSFLMHVMEESNHLEQQHQELLKNLESVFQLDAGLILQNTSDFVTQIQARNGQSSQKEEAWEKSAMQQASIISTLRAKIEALENQLNVAQNNDFETFSIGSYSMLSDNSDSEEFVEIESKKEAASVSPESDYSSIGKERLSDKILIKYLSEELCRLQKPADISAPIVAESLASSGASTQSLVISINQLNDEENAESDDELLREWEFASDAALLEEGEGPKAQKYTERTAQSVQTMDLLRCDQGTQAPCKLTECLLPMCATQKESMRMKIEDLESELSRKLENKPIREDQPENVTPTSDAASPSPLPIAEAAILKVSTEGYVLVDDKVSGKYYPRPRYHKGIPLVDRPLEFVECPSSGDGEWPSVTTLSYLESIEELQQQVMTLKKLKLDAETEIHTLRASLLDEEARTAYLMKQLHMHAAAEASRCNLTDCLKARINTLRGTCERDRAIFDLEGGSHMSQGRFGPSVYSPFSPDSADFWGTDVRLLWPRSSTCLPPTVVSINVTPFKMALIYVLALHAGGILFFWSNIRVF